MEPFDITVIINGKEKDFLVVPFTDEDKFNLFYGLRALGSIQPKLVDGHTTWHSETEMPEELLNQISAEIVKNIIAAG
ncbi:MAG: hypothetical protein V4687_19225 [Bacteroidota bacterium]